MSEIHPKKIGQTANRFIQLRQKILLDKKTNQNLQLIDLHLFSPMYYIKFQAIII